MNIEDFAQKFLASKVFAKNGYRPLVKVVAKYAELQRSPNGEGIHTPFSLCGDILKQLALSVRLQESQIIVLFNLEFVDMLITDYQVPAKNICFVCDSNAKERAARVWYGIKDVHTVMYEKAIGVDIVPKIKKQFDCVIMNPPYQEPPINGATSKRSKGGGNTLWDQFISLGIQLLHDNGHLAVVSPSGWRNIGGRFAAVGKLLKSIQIKHLEIYNADAGLKTFGAGTRYDWYIAQNRPPTDKTNVLGEDHKVHEIYLPDMPFIPNGMCDDVLHLFAEQPTDRVNYLFDCSYHAANGPVSKEKIGKFQYPCIQHVSAKDNIPSCVYYSSTNKKGHFGVPKVILGRQISGVLVDETGSFGMCQDCFAIVDDPRNLGKIQQAMLSERFIQLMKMCDVGGTRDRYNQRAIACLRKDFWKEFI